MRPSTKPLLWLILGVILGILALPWLLMALGYYFDWVFGL